MADFAAGFSSDELINEALTITNNKAYLIPLNSKKARVTNWTPAGKVMAHDTRLAAHNIGKPINEHLFPYVGIQGVYVRARRFLSIESGVTRADGTYTCGGSFGGGGNYALYWEAPDFDVRSGGLGQAWVNGPYLASDWNINFTGGVDRFYAHVFRGAWRYHYGNIDGLCRPGRMPDPRFAGLINSAIKYAAYDNVGTDAEGINYGNWTIFGTNPNIGVWRYENDINNGVMERESDEAFSTTIHETAHSTHMRISSINQFLNVSSFIRESWAIGLELYLTSLEYRERGISNYGNHGYSQPNLGYPMSDAYQYWKRDIGDLYDNSSIYIDLVDSFNQNILSPNPYVQYPNDQVFGYNFNILERNVVRYTYGLSSLGTNLKSNKPNSSISDPMIDNFIQEYTKP